jgi:chromosome partitioning protein
VNELKNFIDDAAGKAMPWSDAKIFATKIRRNIKLAESPSFGKPIISYDAASNGAQDYRALAREVMAMTGEVAVGELASARGKEVAEPQPEVEVAINKPVIERIAPTQDAQPTEVAA